MVFLRGALVTIWLTFLVALSGTILGVAIGFLRRSRSWLISQAANVYIELFRALPILVLLIWMYYVVPLLFGLRLSPFAAAFIALTTNLAAYVAETFRAGIEAIPKNQFDSGITLGLSYFDVMFRIILPQAFRNMLPNLLGLYITQLKNSSLASVIAVNEILHQSNLVISKTFRPLEIYSTVAVIYLLIIIPVTLLANKMEKRLAKRTKHI